MAVHYKFNAAKEFDTLPVDGLHISLADLKESIIHHKRLGKGDVCDLQVTNAETKEIYKNEKDLIPKNSSLIIARVPIDPLLKKMGDLSRTDKELLLSNPEYRMNTEGSEEAAALLRRLEEMPDLTKFAGTEEEKISAMMAQSTIDFHPSRYLKLRNTVMSGEVPPFYKCYKCHQGGHWVSNCPLNNQDLRKCSGIPSRFLVEVEDPKAPGAMVNKNGKYVVFRQNIEIMDNPKEKIALVRTIEPPPPELKCLLCNELMQDAVLTPCCANAYCDDCIRNHLLESEDSTCPTCCKSNVPPDTLIPNRYLRLKIMQFGHQFLTELPKPNENGVISGSSSVVSMRSLPDKFTRLPKHNQSIASSPNRTSSPLVLNDLLQIEEEERAKALKKREAPSSSDGEREDGHRDTESLSSKERKRLKKAKKKKHHETEGKEKKHKKDKDKKKKKKDKKKMEKDSNKSLSEDGGGPASGSELNKSSDALMNEALVYRLHPSSFPPPRNTLPPQPQLPPHIHPLQYLGAPVIRPMIPIHPQVHPHFAHMHPIQAVHPHQPPFLNAPVDDPLATFEQYLRQKDARKRYRSRSSSRSPPYYGSNHSRPTGHHRSRSRSPHGSNWKGGGGWSPTHSRRNYSPSSPSSSSRRGYRSRSRSPAHHSKSSPYSSHLRSSDSQVHSPYKSSQEKYRSKDRKDYRSSDHATSHQDDYHASHHRHRIEGSDDVAPKSLSGMERSSFKDTREGIQRPPYEPDNSSQFNRHSGENVNQRDDMRNRSDDRKGIVDDRRRRDASKEAIPEGMPSKRHEDGLRKRDSTGSRHHDGSKRSRGSPYEDDGRREQRRRDDRRREDSRERSKRGRRKEDERKKKSPPSGYHSPSSVAARDYGISRTVDKKNETTESKDEVKDIANRSREKKSKEKEGKLETASKDRENEGRVKEEEDKDKKRHERKKKKKEKRRVSQGSTGENDSEEKKLRKKEKKLKKMEKIEKGIEAVPEEEEETQTPAALEAEAEEPSVNPYTSVVSKWDKEELDKSSIHSLEYLKSTSNDDKLITSDILKRAENVLFSKSISGRPLPNKKSQSEKLKSKSDSKKDLNSNPEWELSDSREARKRGASIQITISSTSEAQIGRPKIPKGEISPHLEKTVDLPPTKKDIKSKKSKPEKNVNNKNESTKTESVRDSPAQKPDDDKETRTKEETEVSQEHDGVSAEITTEKLDTSLEEPLITFSPGEQTLDFDTSLDQPADSSILAKDDSIDLNKKEIVEDGQGVDDETKKVEPQQTTEAEVTGNEAFLKTDNPSAPTEFTDNYSHSMANPPVMNTFVNKTTPEVPTVTHASKKKKKRIRTSSTSSISSSSSSSSSSTSDEEEQKRRKKAKKKLKKKLKKKRRNKTEEGSENNADDDSHKEKKKKDRKKKKRKKSKDD